MSSLRNFVQIPGIVVPNTLENKLSFVANFQITQEEADFFHVSLNAISKQLEEDGIENDELTRVNVVFTKDGSFQFIDEGVNESLGLHLSLAIYAMERIRAEVNKKNIVIYFIVFIEELVHHFWRIEDEVKTKEKLVEILNRILEHPVEITDVFPREWLNEELIRQGKKAKY